jgi:hypothetical protein
MEIVDDEQRHVEITRLELTHAIDTDSLHERVPQFVRRRDNDPAIGMQ